MCCNSNYCRRDCASQISNYLGFADWVGSRCTDPSVAISLLEKAAECSELSGVPLRVDIERFKLKIYLSAVGNLITSDLPKGTIIDKSLEYLSKVKELLGDKHKADEELKRIEQTVDKLVA